MLTPHSIKKLSQALPSIMGRSRSLALTLSQSVNESAFAAIDKTFSWALHNGGADELGFVRLEGTSFNPRLARVAEILIRDGEVRDEATICAALLACASRQGELLDLVSSEVVEIATTALGLVRGEEAIEDALPKRELFALSLALAVDAFRHAHLATDTETVKSWFNLPQDSRSLAESLYTERFPRYLTVAEQWERYRNYFIGWERRHVRG